MITTINEFKLILESNIKFDNIHLDYHNNQNDYIINAKVNGEIVAYAEYSVYKGKVYISMIESFVKGKEYGKAVMLELAKLYGYENIERNSLTPDGIKLRKKVDKELNFDYDKYIEDQNKHINTDEISKIKNEFIKKIISYCIINGYTETYAKYKNEIQEFIESNNYKKIGLDINDIFDICEWVKYSIENNNNTTHDVPKDIKYNLFKLQHLNI